MANENLVHIRFDYGEALQSKKDLLYVEKSSINATEIVREFISLKSKKSRKESGLHKKTRGLISSLKKIQKNLPEVDFPGIAHKKIAKKVIRKKDQPNESVEAELKEIQRKLKAIQG